MCVCVEGAILDVYSTNAIVSIKHFLPEPLSPSTGTIYYSIHWLAMMSPQSSGQAWGFGKYANRHRGLQFRLHGNNQGKKPLDGVLCKCCVNQQKYIAHTHAHGTQSHTHTHTAHTNKHKYKQSRDQQLPLNTSTIEGENITSENKFLCLSLPSHSPVYAH